MLTGNTSVAFARLVAFWDRLRSSSLLQGALLLAVVATLVALAALVPSPEHSVLMRFSASIFPMQAFPKALGA